MPDHPITPPPELVEQWIDKPFATGAYRLVSITKDPLHGIATQAARWGADQELEACCAIAISDPVCGTKHQRNMLVRHIREQRRPKPPSLKDQALEALYQIESERPTGSFGETIRRALEVLDD